MLLITGLIGMLCLCSFSWAFIVGGDGFFWFRCFILCLSIIRLHCCNAFCMSFWYLLVGLFGANGNCCLLGMCVLFFWVFIGIYDDYCPAFVFAFSVTSFWTSCLLIYNCLFCVVLWWWSELKICLSVLAVYIKIKLRNTTSCWLLLYERLV